VSESTPPTQVGFIGLGNMGTPMAGHLLNAGFAVRGFDLSEAARGRLTDAGGMAVTTAAAAVEGSEITILMLPDSNVVEAVVGDPELQRMLRPDSVVVDMSSSEPLRTQALAAELRRSEHTLIDAPVSGGVGGAVAATLTIMVGGTGADVERVRPVLSQLGKIIHVGDVGAGHALKALNNLLSATHLLSTSAAVVTGIRFGLDPEVMLSVINSSSGRSASSENKLPKFVLTQTYDSGFGLRLMLKDMRIAVELARQLGCPDELGEDAVGIWSEAAQALPPTADHTEIARWVSTRAQPASQR
jgi:3-hydroxyisobutyrate dehydrogenase